MIKKIVQNEVSINKDEKKICCLIGHRNIKLPENLNERLENLIERFILLIDVKKFSLAGRHLYFERMCYDTLKRLQKRFPEIEINIYTDDLDDQENVVGLYDKMILESDYCIFYCNENYVYKQPGIRMKSFPIQHRAKIAFGHANLLSRIRSYTNKPLMIKNLWTSN